MGTARRLLGSVRLISFLSLVSVLVGGTLAAPATAAAQAAAGSEIVVPAAARAVPRATRILNAGDSGFLWAQEGDDRLLWTAYASGATNALPQRLPEKLVYDVDSGYFRNGPSFQAGWYGAGSDVVATLDGSEVELRDTTGVLRTVSLPEGHSYRGTFGGVVLSRSGGDGTPEAYHLWRPAGSETVVMPEGAEQIQVEDGDARSVVLRFQTAEGSRWGILDLATAVVTPLTGDDGWAADAVRLAAGSVLRIRSGWMKLDLYDRDDLSAEPRQVDSGAFSYEAEYGVVGSTILAVEPVWPGNNLYRGQTLWAVSATDADPDQVSVMNPAAHQIAAAPDGSVLVAGAAEYRATGDLDWGIYRVSRQADGSIVRSRVTAVQPMPAQVHGLALGSGILSTASAGDHYSPGDVIGAYRSDWLGTSGVVRSSVDGYVASWEGYCGESQPRCITMFADGAGHQGRLMNAQSDRTTLTVNGKSTPGPSVTSGLDSPQLGELSGRYGVINSASSTAQQIVDFRRGAVLQKRNRVGTAIWGDILWSGAAEGGTVQAKRISSGAAVESFTTHNGCTPSELQAAGRFVYYTCVDYWGGVQGSGLYDRVAKRTTTAPAGDVLLGDGYLVEKADGAGLRLFDLHGGLPAGGSHTAIPSRVLVTAAQLGTFTERRTSWTVDRFGGGVAYADDQQRVHVVPSGVPAPAISVIDSVTGTAAANWTGDWWLSKPAASWQLTFKNTAGATLRTINGSTAYGLIHATWDGKDSAGKAVADGTFTWTLTAKPADGIGAALTTGTAPAPLTATRAPAIGGTVAVGSTVTASTGTWSPAPTSYAYQWAAGGVAIKGATGSSYAIPASLLGKRLTVTVTAKRAGHPNGVSTSAASAAVAAGRAPKATKAPAVTGTVAVGSTVKATAGTWSPAASSYAYQWAANGVAIKGATGSSYTISASQLGKRLTVTVTAKRAGHTNGVAKSASSAKVAKGKAPKATKKPKVTGTAKVGKKVKASVGTWSPKATSYRYEWRLNGKLIKGATGATLKLKSSMRKKKLTVTVIAKRTGHTDGRATSASVKIR
ncbi:FlgD immunoglobulin-like domain containing protein [Actinoplanes sp. NPDC023714]|uniref:FlgD immunoglobulin-like domain containing protein n=1 Tax=Actinoplanes sp. NPDC023714 TaxID=3154322 RepID=UPI0033C72C2D